MPTRLRVLTACELSQSPCRYRQLAATIKEHRPDVLVLPGNFLRNESTHADKTFELPLNHCALLLAELPVKEIVFVCGANEGRNWRQFVAVWPFKQKRLHALYGSAFTMGPLVIVGFPCSLGWDKPWRSSLPKKGNCLKPEESVGRRSLPMAANVWLQRLFRHHGPAARTLWVMHEAPIIESAEECLATNSYWKRMVERFSPLVTAFNGGHRSPSTNGKLYSELAETVSIFDQPSSKERLSGSVIDFEFSGRKPALPEAVTVGYFVCYDGDDHQAPKRPNLATSLQTSYNHRGENYFAQVDT